MIFRGKLASPQHPSLSRLVRGVEAGADAAEIALKRTEAERRRFKRFIGI